jgi:hypothetical protein
MIGKKINQLATELAPVSTDLTIIGDPDSGVSKKITLAQLGAIFSGAVSFYTNLASFPVVGDINVIYCAKDTQKLYLWSGSAYVEVFPSQALLDTYQLRSEKGNANGYASLDSQGKVPISQLPSSIMEYKGTWNAATNTPTLANGTGDTGDVYICNVAGTVNFGAGPITFAVGDYTIYSGSIWQRSSGAVGTVTSVAVTRSGDALAITGSPITTSGTINLGFAGNSTQYINGAGNLTTFPSLTGYVPYTGATANVDLGTFDLTADFITATRGSYTSSGGGNTLEVTHSSGGGIALNITKGGNGEGLYINKTSGSGNAATIVGTLNATTLVKSGGTSTQFLKADGSVDTNTYLTTSAAATTYLPMVLSSTAKDIDINGQTFDVSSKTSPFTSGRLIVTPTFSALGYQNSGVFNGFKILTDGSAEFSNSGITRFFNQVRFDNTLTNGTYNYTLPGASGTLALTSQLTGGTVTSVAALSLGTTGTDLNSTVVNSTTTPVITLNVPTASATNRGALSSTDWTTFNNKQNALTNPVTGTGTTNYLPKFTGASTIGNSAITDNGSLISVGLNTLFSGYIDGLGLRATSSSAFGGTGVGVEIGYSGGLGYIQAYNRSTSAYQPIKVDGSTVSLNISGVQKLFLDASGNLGLGVTPSAWISGNLAFEIVSASGLSSDGTSIRMQTNAFVNTSGSWIYKSNGAASFYTTGAGTHAWYTAPSGTAGNAISFTQAMTLDASGRLGIGSTSPSQKLVVQESGDAFIQIRNNTAGQNLFIGALSTETRLNNDNATPLTFWVNGSERFRIASTGAATFSSSVAATSGLFKVNADRNLAIKYDTNIAISAQNDAGNPESVRYYADTFRIYTATTAAGLTERFTIASTGAATFSSSVTATQFTSQGGRGTSFGYKLPDWQIYNTTSGNALAFSNYTSDLLYITSGGNVGIGTTSPSWLLQLEKNSSGAGAGTYPALVVNNPNAAGYSAMYFFNGATNVGGLEYSNSTTNLLLNAYGALIFQTGSGSERMRITSGGSLLVGTTSELQSATSKLNIAGDFYNANGVSLKTTNGGSGSQFVGFINESGTLIGSINRVAATNAVAYNTTSDYRLKEDLKSINGLEIVNKIKVYDYKWKSDNSRMDGVLAHELAEVLPYAVTGIKDGEKMQQVDYSKIVPVLIQSVKELKAELDTLKNK